MFLDKIVNAQPKADDKRSNETEDVLLLDSELLSLQKYRKLKSKTNYNGGR